MFKNIIPALQKNKKGFSLVELLVVVTIIAILSVVAFMTLGGETPKARDASRLNTLTTLASALQTYQLQNGSYPDELSDMPRSIISDIPTDPGRGGNEYAYYVGGGGTTYAIAATLENDGNPANYEVHLITNSDSDIAETEGTLGKYHVGDGELADCSAGRIILKGQIGGSDDDGNCIPYDPNTEPTP